MTRRRVTLGLSMLLLVMTLAALRAAAPAAEQASQPSSPAAGQLDAGLMDTCAVLPDGSARCWGYGGEGELGYGNTGNVGDVDTPAQAGPIDFGGGLTVKAISAGNYHTCAILSDGSVRCWGFGGDGRLGYGSITSVDSPASVGPVNLGPGRTAAAISAGGAHTCAILDNGNVLCWGFGTDGELGYGDVFSLGDINLPGTHAPVYLGPGRTATAIAAGDLHTCAILDDGSVECWGFGGNGELGHGDTNPIGNTATSTPGMVGPVDLGGHKATAITAGAEFTCVILDDGSVECWGYGGNGELGYGNTNNVGDTEVPELAGPVDLGPGRTAKAISAGQDHVCAILDNGSVECWGNGTNGELGYGTTGSVGATQTPGSVGAVDLGPGRTAVAIAAGGDHTCALLDNGTVKCWGYGAYGETGLCSTANVGDTSTPASVGTVNLQPGDGGVECAPYAIAPNPTPPGPTSKPTPPRSTPPGVAAEAARAKAFRRCLAAARSKAGRRKCVRRYGATPGRITALRARARGRTEIELRFAAVGTSASKPPPATRYLVKQSRRPIRSQRDFNEAHTLCRGACRFTVTVVGGPIALAVTHLRARTTYYYAVAARDNVSGRLGPRSPTAEATTA